MPKDDLGLIGRQSERRMLDGLLNAAQAGGGAALVLRGEAGIGKSALLQYCEETATGFRIRRAVGVESETELPFAALHQLCAPLLDHLSALPQPQQNALTVALGISQGEPPERFLVSLAALSLLSEAAGHQPLLCLVDDAQWLDSASRQVFEFIGRRLLAERIAIVFAVRTPSREADFNGLAVLPIEGLTKADARLLLASVIIGPLDRGVRERLLAEARGNPLALLELPRRMNPSQLPGALGLLAPRELPSSIESAFAERIDALSEAARLLLLVAAAEPADDPQLLRDAAGRLGIEADAALATETAGLLAVDNHVRFRHPLVRSAAYRAATPHDRRRVHRSLAESLGPAADADRRAWHLAAAALGPDEQVAQELEASADRARARGGLASAAAFLRRSVVLTEEPEHRLERALAAARVSLHAGEFEAALDALTYVRGGSLDPGLQARVDLLRGQVSLASGAASHAATLLLATAKKLDGLDDDLACEAYLDAWAGALFGGDTSETTMRDVSVAVQASPPRHDASDGSDLLLLGMSSLILDGRAAAQPTLRRAVRTYLNSSPLEERGMRWAVIAACASVELWDFESWNQTLGRQMRQARESGALGALAISLSGLGLVLAWSGDLDGADRVGAESEVISEATGTQIAAFGGMLLAAVRGREPESRLIIESAGERAALDGDGFAHQFSHWTMAMLANGLCRYEDALAYAQRTWDAWPDLFVSVWAMVEFVEAAARLRQPHLAVEPLSRIIASAERGGSDWALGIAARSQALLDDTDAAETLYRKAIEHLGATPLRPELARSHLVYGEWLRRGGRQNEAHAQLGLAFSMFNEMGLEGFAERARHEVEASGATSRKKGERKREGLTGREAHIARLAASGLTNSQIGAELYLSRHTIEWHLRKVFQKLEVTSRRDLRVALGDDLEDPGFSVSS
ncbi:AAA family ATPase [Nocardioides sp. YIM 152315]|uniref:helix-turn-helix transcriptional regulator n=1 Tax=Nocardioides sp. YIM 152315 TaxID=3031760 RepID=UPI0023DA9737|nr:AAA family ATPase [Nocardioides sp. YIM 152315]MDF1602039.1 AAA family ATPase [Nocardioides sp. YIM 152315]